jgi:hypothetical protein
VTAAASLILIDAESHLDCRAAGDARTWAQESYAIAKKDAYQLPSLPTCTTKGDVALSDAYQAAARKDAALQLEKAGMRMASELNRILG